MRKMHTGLCYEKFKKIPTENELLTIAMRLRNVSE